MESNLLEASNSKDIKTSTGFTVQSFFPSRVSETCSLRLVKPEGFNAFNQKMYFLPSTLFAQCADSPADMDDDGRIKPDLVASGISLYSSISST